MNLKLQIMRLVLTNQSALFQTSRGTYAILKFVRSAQVSLKFLLTKLHKKLLTELHKKLLTEKLIWPNRR